MIKKLLLSATLVGFTVIAGEAANATPITVVNGSFETLPAGGLNNMGCGAGCAYSTGLGIPGWVTTGGAVTGQFQPGSSGAYFNSVPNGITVAYTNGGTISQTVSATALANQIYSLQVDLGFRKDVADPGTITLQIGSHSILATGVPAPLSGNFVTYSAFFTTTAADAGSAISISLASAAAQGDFDNVRLDASPVSVPEPLTLSIFGAGVAGVAVVRRRRK